MEQMEDQKRRKLNVYICSIVELNDPKPRSCLHPTRENISDSETRLRATCALVNKRYRPYYFRQSHSITWHCNLLELGGNR